MTKNEVHDLFEAWKNTKPTVYVLLMRRKSVEQWGDDGYGETDYAGTVAELQETVNGLCSLRGGDYCDVQFAAGIYEPDQRVENLDIEERLYDESEDDSEV